MQCWKLHYIAVQCSAVKYGAVQNITVPCSAEHYSAMQCRTLQCHAVQNIRVPCSTEHYSAMQCRTLQCHAVQYCIQAWHAVQCNTVKCPLGCPNIPKLRVSWSLIVANDVSIPRELFPKISEFMKINWLGAARISL